MRRYARFFAMFAALLISLVPASAQTSEDQGLLIDWHPDGTMIAYAVHESNEVVIWDTLSNTVLNQFATEDAQRDRPEWSPDGQLLAFRDSLNSISVWSNAWDSNLAARIHHLDRLTRLETSRAAPISGFDWHPSGTSIAHSAGVALYIWDITTNDYKEVQFPSNLRSFDIDDIKWFDADTLLFGNSAPGAVLINSSSGQIEAMFLFRGTIDIVSISAVTYSPDRSLIALGSSLGQLAIWDPAQGEFNDTVGLVSDEGIRSTFGSDYRINSLEWNATGEYIAMADEIGIIRVWNADTLELVQEYNQGPVFNSVAWSPNGMQLAFGTASGGLQIVDIPPVAP